MEVTPHELRDLDIADAFRGYNRDEVNDLLERAAGTIETQAEKIRILTERVGTATADVGRSRDNDDILQRTLILAQRAADDAIASANADAESLRASASADAEAVRANAHVEANAALGRAREEIQRLNDVERGRIEREVLDLANRREALISNVAALEAWDSDYRERLVRQIESDLQAARRRPTVTSGAQPEIVEVKLDDLRPAATPMPVAASAPVATLEAALAEHVASAAALPLVGSAVNSEVVEVAEPLLDRTVAPVLTPTPVVATTVVATPDAPATVVVPPAPAPAAKALADIDLRAAEADRASLDDDEFFATLRDAVRDDAPLGPNDEELVSDGRDPSFREMFKRRR